MHATIPQSNHNNHMIMSGKQTLVVWENLLIPSLPFFISNNDDDKLISTENTLMTTVWLIID